MSDFFITDIETFEPKAEKRKLLFETNMSMAKRTKTLNTDLVIQHDNKEIEGPNRPEVIVPESSFSDTRKER